MQYLKRYMEELGVIVELASFAPKGKTAEWHAMLHVEARGETFLPQYQRLCRAEAELMGMVDLQDAQPVFKRYFLSDATNQQPLIKHDAPCAISFIQQPPLDGSKVALWVYLQRGTEVQHHADRLNSTVVRHNGYRHIWTMGMNNSCGDSYQQTKALFEDYEQLLDGYNACLAEHGIRTWFFVRDVDTQYHGLVVARREHFNRIGLTSQTHYISSTGIGGNPSDPKALIQLGCYAMTGFEPGQQRYLYAPTHLNRTSDYGVTFERGTLLQFGDRNHALISGTASINCRGEEEHVGDIEKQTERMWENVEKLLEEGGMTAHDIAQIIVYLRDLADYTTVSAMFAKRYPLIPTVITQAPVCRPAWLIEMECIAIRQAEHSRYKDF